MGVPNVDATTKFLVLSHHVDQHCLPANTEFIHVVQPLSFSTTTNNLLGENILVKKERMKVLVFQPL